MAYPRFYCPSIPREHGSLPVELDAEQSRHGARVLRLDEGQAVELFDGGGTVARGRWRHGRPNAKVVIESLRHEPMPMPTIDVAVSMPKGPRADQLVASVSQAGADRLVPLRSERTVVVPRDTKQRRLGKLAVESAKQCGRAHVLGLGRPAALAELADEAHDLVLIADPAGASDADWRQHLTGVRRVLVLIGPEGGWSERDRADAHALGAVPWCLGPFVMRIEIAAPAAVAILRYLAR
jgi:16S rRNA (uracil1498-N3)-methyltransferase